MTTHIVVRITADMDKPLNRHQHTAYGPCSKDEAMDLLAASHSLLAGLGLKVRPNATENYLTAYKAGSRITWKVLVVELRPPNEDVCEGIT